MRREGTRDRRQSGTYSIPSKVEQRRLSCDDSVLASSHILDLGVSIELTQNQIKSILLLYVGRGQESDTQISYSSRRNYTLPNFESAHETN